MKKITFFILFVTTAVMLAGCQNTVRGFGEDMQNTGEQIKHSVN